MPSEKHEIIGGCGKTIIAKIWKQGGTIKCPDHWTMNTYPMPTLQKPREDVFRFCSTCEDRK